MQIDNSSIRFGSFPRFVPVKVSARHDRSLGFQGFRVRVEDFFGFRASGSRIISPSWFRGFRTSSRNPHRSPCRIFTEIRMRLP